MSTLRSEPAALPPTASGGPHLAALPPLREQFIPLRKADLVDRLAGELDATEAALFRNFCGLLQATIHHEFHRTLETLKDDYAPFDPDADTRPVAELSAAELAQRRNALFEKFA